MRVIAGSARRLKLVTPEGLDTRPTSDQIKETLFNILAPLLDADSRFLDLFAGSGQMGIEALSRGAGEAVFVDSGRDAINCINKNLETTRLSDQARVMHSDCVSAVLSLKGKGKFDIIFMDPPYGRDLEKDILNLLSDSDIVSEDTLIVVEARKETDFSYVTSMGYSIKREKIYKTNKHVFLERI